MKRAQPVSSSLSTGKLALPVASLLIVFIILLLSAPWLCGWVYKRQYLQLLSNIKTEGKFDLKTDYQLGWVRSHVTMTLVRRDVPASASTFVAEETITHGPIVWDPIRHAYRFALATSTETVSFPHLFPGSSAYTMSGNSIMTFGLHYISEFSLPLMAYPLRDGVQWSSQGLYIQSKAVLNHGVVNLNELSLHLKRLALLAQNITLFDSHDYAFQGYFTTNDMGVLEGSYTATIAELSTPNDPVYRLKNITHTAVFRVVGKNDYQKEASLTIGEVTMPSLTMAPVTLRMSTKGINAEAIAAIEKNQKNLSIEDQGHYWLSIITPNTVVTSDLALTTDQGKLVMNAVVSWPKDKPLPVAGRDLMNIDVTLNAHADKALVDQLMGVAAKTLANIIPLPRIQKAEQAMEDSKSASPLPATTKDQAKGKVPAQPFSPQQALLDIMQYQLSKAVQKGYVLLDANSYSLALSIHDASLTLNGNAMSQATPTPAATPQPTGQSQPVKVTDIPSVATH